MTRGAADHGALDATGGEGNLAGAEQQSRQGKGRQELHGGDLSWVRSNVL
jgi:hypothetical protein